MGSAVKLPSVKLPKIPTLSDITESVKGAVGDVGEGIKDLASDPLTLLNPTVAIANLATDFGLSTLGLPTISDITEDVKDTLGDVGEGIKTSLGIGSGDIDPPEQPKEKDIPTEEEVEEEAKKAREFENIKLSGLMGRGSTIKKKKLGTLSIATEALRGR